MKKPTFNDMGELDTRSYPTLGKLAKKVPNLLVDLIEEGFLPPPQILYIIDEMEKNLSGLEKKELFLRILKMEAGKIVDRRIAKYLKIDFPPDFPPEIA